MPNAESFNSLQWQDTGHVSKVTLHKLCAAQQRRLLKLTPSSIEYTKGHQHKLLKKSAWYDIRKHYFTERIVNMWNSLPDAVAVVNSTINQFKNARNDV